MGGSSCLSGALRVATWVNLSIVLIYSLYYLSLAPSCGLRIEFNQFHKHYTYPSSHCLVYVIYIYYWGGITCFPLTNNNFNTLFMVQVLFISLPRTSVFKSQLQRHKRVHLSLLNNLKDTVLSSSAAVQPMEYATTIQFTYMYF